MTCSSGGCSGAPGVEAAFEAAAIDIECEQDLVNFAHGNRDA